MPGLSRFAAVSLAAHASLLGLALMGARAPSSEPSPQQLPQSRATPIALALADETTTEVGAARPASPSTRAQASGPRAATDSPAARLPRTPPAQRKASASARSRRRRRPRATSATRATAKGVAGSDAPRHPASPSRPAALSGNQDEAHETSLVDAFVLAASIANEGDPAWHQLPLGEAGTLRLRLRWNAEGHIVGAQTLSPPLPHLERVKRRSLLSLHQGRFLRRSRGGAGSVTLVVSAQIALEAKEQTDTSNPRAAVAHARRFPRSDRPGFAYFRFPSGRSVRLTVEHSD